MDTTSSACRRGATRRTIGSMMLALVIAQAIATSAAEPVKRARPPKFSKAVTDVFFPDAREKLVGPRPEKASAGTPLATGPAATEPAADPPAAGAGSQWAEIISAAVIEDEIKVLNRKLGEAVDNAIQFKGGQFRAARTHLSVLATMFAIDAQYGQQVRWQREAAGMRDLLARAGFNCKAGSDASYQDARARHDDLAALVRGGSIQAPTAAAQASWDKVSDRGPLMKRLEQAHDQGLQPWTANSNALASNADRLSHEAQIVAALATVIQDDGFEYADDETYLEYARDMRNHALAVRDAVEAGDYDRARQSVGEVGKACAGCHEGYRN